jgi:hypothetical protein
MAWAAAWLEKPRSRCSNPVSPTHKQLKEQGSIGAPFPLRRYCNGRAFRAPAAARSKASPSAAARQRVRAPERACRTGRRPGSDAQVSSTSGARSGRGNLRTRGAGTPQQTLAGAWLRGARAGPRPARCPSGARSGRPRRRSPRFRRAFSGTRSDHPAPLGRHGELSAISWSRPGYPPPPRTGPLGRLTSFPRSASRVARSRRMALAMGRERLENQGNVTCPGIARA